MERTLIICIGNVARGDDGAAHEVARTLQTLDLPSHPTLLTAVGLDVAMAADAAEADMLVIVDAHRRSAPAVEVTPLHPGPALRPTGHAIDAPSLLSLTATLYDRTPTSYLVSIAAPEMGHGEELSETAKAASIEAASTILSILNT